MEAAKQVMAGRLMNRGSRDIERGGHIEVTDEQGCVLFTVPLVHRSRERGPPPD
jgi:hypothetical protein